MTEPATAPASLRRLPVAPQRALALQGLHAELTAQLEHDLGLRAVFNRDEADFGEEAARRISAAVDAWEAVLVAAGSGDGDTVVEDWAFNTELEFLAAAVGSEEIASVLFARRLLCGGTPGGPITVEGLVPAPRSSASNGAS